MSLKPGTDAYNCVTCGATPFEAPIYRRLPDQTWYCADHREHGRYYQGPLYLPRGEYHADGPQAAIKTFSLGGIECPASMCPLFAKSGSPNAHVYAGACPEHDDLDYGGCPWWKIGCSTGLQHKMVDQAPVTAKPGRTYDCPKASVCSWQKSAEANGVELCPPRTALMLGVDPKVVNWA